MALKDFDLIEENRKAHKELAARDEARTTAEIKHRDAKIAHDSIKAELEYKYKEFMKSDPVGANAEIRKGTAEAFAKWVDAEGKLWKANLAYRKAGYRVDCIKNEIELRKSALGTH
ncbi:MAG: hypothetical protein WC455_24425 [Dehalococcoidia bacterium]|jgi:hypothetical protein